MDCSDVAHEGGRSPRLVRECRFPAGVFSMSLSSQQPEPQQIEPVSSAVKSQRPGFAVRLPSTSQDILAAPTKLRR